jgi:hypothetical protein
VPFELCFLHALKQIRKMSLVLSGNRRWHCFDLEGFLL